MDSHERTILDQFSRQAKPFAAAAPIRSAEALQFLIDAAAPSAIDTALDVACGPGLVTCAFGPHVRRAIGLDITPAMLECAREEQRQQRLSNISWVRGDAAQLPFSDGAFTIATSRFAFHHSLNPLGLLEEMRRVCVPGGRILVADSSPAADKATQFNRMEQLRDPSHTRAMPPGELLSLFDAADLPAPRLTSYRLEGDLDSLLARSFYEAGDAVLIREMFEEAIDDDHLDMCVRRDGPLIRYSFPVVILVSVRS